MQPVSRAQIRVALLNAISQALGCSLPKAQFRLGPIAWKNSCGGTAGCEWHLPELSIVPEHAGTIQQAIGAVRARYPLVLCWNATKPRADAVSPVAEAE